MPPPNFFMNKIHQLTKIALSSITLQSSRRSLNTKFRKRHSVFRRSQVPSQSITKAYFRRSYVLPSLSTICNGVSDRLLLEPRHCKLSFYIFSPFIFSSPSTCSSTSLEHPSTISAHHISVLLK